MFGAWAAHSVSIRRSVPPVTRQSGAVSGACFAIDHFSQPGPFPPRPPPPLLTALFEPFNSTMDPSDSSCLPDRLRPFELPSPARALRLRATGGLPGSDAFLSGVMWSPTPAE
jgi:hypothetical protein